MDQRHQVREVEYRQARLRLNLRCVRWKQGTFQQDRSDGGIRQEQRFCDFNRLSLSTNNVECLTIVPSGGGKLWTAVHPGNANGVGVGASRHEEIHQEALSLDQAAAIARAWSLVHGFTMLLLDGRLKNILHRLPQGTDAETLLDAMLRITVGKPPGC